MIKKNSTPAKDSLAISTDFVLPGQTNPMNTLFGGELLSKQDRIGYISACRHAKSFNVVTVAINNVSFQKPIPLGNILTLEAKVSRAFGSSMEVIIDVWIENLETRLKTKVCEAIYTFIAIDKNRKPVQVPDLIPETDLEKERYTAALRRKQLSLVSSGKLNPSEAKELRAFINRDAGC